MKYKIELAKRFIANQNDIDAIIELKNLFLFTEKASFLELYMDNYSSDNRILWLDIAQRYLDDELDDTDELEASDIKWAEGFGSKEKLEEQMFQWEMECAMEAVINFIRKNTKEKPILEPFIELFSYRIFGDGEVHSCDCICYDGFAVCFCFEPERIFLQTYPKLEEVLKDTDLCDEIRIYRGIPISEELHYGDVMMKFGEIV